MDQTRQSSTIIVFLTLFVCAMFAWDYGFQKVTSSDTDTLYNHYVKAHTFVGTSYTTSLRYRAKAHTPVIEGAR
jgi:hypothetical protein